MSNNRNGESIGKAKARPYHGGVTPDLIDHFRALCKRNRDGSFNTQANRLSMLEMFARELTQAGFRIKELRPEDIKGRHVNTLLKIWRDGGIADATIKNRMSIVRWWAEKVGNPGAVKSNDDLGIGRREYVTNENKSVSTKDVDFTRFSQHIGFSLRLQEAFGLRREEAMKFQPDYALAGKHPDLAESIQLKGSWTKGGRDRTIPILNDEQRKLLWLVQRFADKGSLIPKDRSYKDHMKAWERETAAAGIGKTHGLRHAYAQRRYLEITGFEPPAIAGVRVLSKDEKVVDKAARLTISNELGHSRTAITNAYLGSWFKK